MHYTPEEEDRIRAEIDAAKAEMSSASAPSETACQPRSLALANCCLWVPAGKLLELARRYEKEVELLNRFRADFDQYDGMANALAQVSLDLRLLAGDATERQPTDNNVIFDPHENPR